MQNSSNFVRRLDDDEFDDDFEEHFFDEEAQQQDRKVLWNSSNSLSFQIPDQMLGDVH